MSSTMPPFHHVRTPATLGSFPQPTRPVNSYSLDSSSPPTAYPYGVDSSTFRPQDHRHFYPNQEQAAVDEENETAEELVVKINELYQKLPENIKSKVKFDINVPSKMMRDLKVASNDSRGIERSSSVELSHKLERFKIRTVQIGGIVSDDETKQDEK